MRDNKEAFIDMRTFRKPIHCTTYFFPFFYYEKISNIY